MDKYSHSVFDASLFIHANYHIAQRYGGCSDIELANKVKNQIQSIHFSKFPSCNLVLALDSDTLFRKNIYPGYKGERSHNKFDREVVHNILKQHFYCIEFDGLEADDLGYIFANRNPGTVLISEDNDWKLMLNEHTILYKYKSDKFIQYSEKDLVLEQLFKVCGGCKMDSVPSIKRQTFGIKKLNQTIDLFGLNLNDTLDALYLSDFIDDPMMNTRLVIYNESTYDLFVDNFENLQV